MFAHKKIVKEKGAEPEPFEVDVAQAICDLEANSNDLKAELRELYIVSAKEVDVSGRKAVVIFVPFKLLKIVHKIQSRLVREVRPPPPLACIRVGLVGEMPRRYEEDGDGGGAGGLSTQRECWRAPPGASSVGVVADGPTSGYGALGFVGLRYTPVQPLPCCPGICRPPVTHTGAASPLSA